jgi:hypothetical protein
MTNNERKILQDLQTHLGFPILEKLMREYIEELGLKGSMKRDTQFDTIWERALAEGGELHLKMFFAQAEAEARKYNY